MQFLIRLLIHETTVLTVIVVNAAALFLDAFPGIHEVTEGVLFWVDYGCVIYFLLEATLKIRVLRGDYWRNGWNCFDFIVVVVSLPTLLAPFYAAAEVFSIVLVFRLARLIRFFRVFRFIPHGPHIWAGVKRALKASVGILVALLILNLVFALGATILFGREAPEHFGDPFISTYSLFRVFTVEGWYEIPDQLAARSQTPCMGLLSRLYFILAVFVGGILGLSLVNAIFVDEMTADNTDRLETMVEALRGELEQFRGESRKEWHASFEVLQEEWREISRRIGDLEKKP